LTLCSPEQFTQPMHPTQSTQRTQATQPTQRVQAMHATHATHSRIRRHNTVNRLPTTPTLPAVPAEPATATLPAVAAEPATATLPAVAAEPATATLPPVATDPATATLSMVAIEPTVEPLSRATAESLRRITDSSSQPRIDVGAPHGYGAGCCATGASTCGDSTASSCFGAARRSHAFRLVATGFAPASATFAPPRAQTEPRAARVGSCALSRQACMPRRPFDQHSRKGNVRGKVVPWLQGAHGRSKCDRFVESSSLPPQFGPANERQRCTAWLRST
jgi:hypothetical protein